MQEQGGVLRRRARTEVAMERAPCEGREGTWGFDAGLRAEIVMRACREPV